MLIRTVQLPSLLVTSYLFFFYFRTVSKPFFQNLATVRAYLSEVMLSNYLDHVFDQSAATVVNLVNANFYFNASTRAF